MLTQIINGRILTPQGWLKDGSVLFCDGKILEVTNSDLAVIGATVIDARGMTIVPGFVSMHAHGGGGHDFTEATEEAFRIAATAHLKHGATGIFPTLSSTSFEKIYQAVDVCEKLMKEPESPILGLHIEGPYLNPKMAGSQYDGFLKTPDENEYIPLLEHTSCIKRWDISPELHGAHDFAKYTRSKGIMTAVTHTEAEYDEIKAAYAVGFSHAAHFYNAMPGFHKRREYKYEGTVESVYLTDGMTVEVIADGIHLPATILKLVYKLKGVENTCLVTDVKKKATKNWEKLEQFIHSHSMIKAYFHGDKNYNEFYTWNGVNGTIDLPVFRVDSPMKGEYSSADERLLSFIVVTMDVNQRLLTARECLWNTENKTSIQWGSSCTITF